MFEAEFCGFCGTDKVVILDTLVNIRMSLLEFSIYNCRLLVVVSCDMNTTKVIHLYFLTIKMSREIKVLLMHAMKTSVYPDSKVANKEFEVVNNIQFLFTLS